MSVRAVDYQRRGRAALLGGAALFAALQLVGGLLLDRYGLPVRFPSATRVLGEVPPGSGLDIAVLGSSRFQDIRGGEVEAVLRHEHPEAGRVTAHNFAVPFGDPIAQDYVLERLLERGVRPRLAVVEVSPEFLNRYNRGYSMHIHRQLTWTDLPGSLVDVCRAEQEMRLLSSRVVPLYVHRRELLRVTLEAAEGWLQRPAHAAAADTDEPRLGEEVVPGREPPLPPETCREWEAGLPDLAKRLAHYRAGGTTAAALDRLLDRCRDNGIDVILVGAPNTSYFRRFFTPEIEAEYRAYIDRLTRTYGCPYFDYADQVPDHLFKDPVHLNAAGSVYFSRRLAREVLWPYERDHGHEPRR